MGGLKISNTALLGSFNNAKRECCLGMMGIIFIVLGNAVIVYFQWVFESISFCVFFSGTDISNIDLALLQSHSTGVEFTNIWAEQSAKRSKYPIDGA